MKKYFKWAAISISIILFLGGLVYFIYNLFRTDVVDNPTPAQQAVINTDYNSASTISKPKDLNSLYTDMHEMANTKIVARDGEIWGLEPMTKGNIDILKQAVKDLNINDNGINEILDRWSKQDFTKCVDDHNYVWNKLDGTIGEAVRLR